MDRYLTRLKHSKEYMQKNMIENKNKVLEDSVNSSYFGFNVTKPMESSQTYFKALIMETAAEDEKIVSTFFKYNVQVGTIIYWKYTNTYWIVYEQNLSEIAHFEGKMLKCKNYQITTEQGDFSTYARITAISEDEEQMFNKTLIVSDNSYLKIIIPYSDKAKEVLKLDTVLKILDKNWKIKTVNYIDVDGLMTIVAEQTAIGTANVTVEEGPKVDDTYIEGPTYILPLEKVTYTVAENLVGEWSVSDNVNIKKIINSDNSLTLMWNNARKRSNFVISYGDYSKEIAVQSLM